MSWEQRFIRNVSTPDSLLLCQHLCIDLLFEFEADAGICKGVSKVDGEKSKFDKNITKPPTGEADEKSGSNSEGSFHSDVTASEIMHYCLITKFQRRRRNKKGGFQ